LAIAFRIQLWVFAAGGSHWTDMLKVDILNSMGLAIALMAPLAMFSTHDRMRLGFVTGLAIACASPIISGLGFQWLHPFIRAYFVPDANFFTFFPWGAFVAFGVSAGSVIRVVKEEDMMKVMQWASLFGIALMVGARYFANLPYSLYGNSDFWLNSPALILIKLGVMYLLLPSPSSGRGMSIQRVGVSSARSARLRCCLLGHTEIVYGQWMWYWKESLTPAPVVSSQRSSSPPWLDSRSPAPVGSNGRDCPHWPRRAGNDSGLNRCKPPRATDRRYSSRSE